MNKRLFSVLLILSLSLFLPHLPVNAAVKAGGVCNKAGQKSISGSKTYTCIKSGKKLVWDKGVSVKSDSSNTSTKTIPLIEKFDSSPNLASDCKILDYRTNKTSPNNVGFPITKQEIPTSGKTKVVFIPIDFADARGIGDPSIKSLKIASEIQDWFKHFSNGKFNIEAQHSNNWFHSPLLSASYSNIHPGTTQGNSTAPLANSLAQQWVNLTGNAFNFDGVSTIFFEFPDTVKGFGAGTQGRNIAIQTNQGTKSVMFNIMGNSWYTEGFMGVSNKFRADHFWSFYVHEMLHSMGLNLHAPGNGIPFSIGANQTGTGEGFSGTLDTWELFLINWLNENQIFCANKNDLKRSTISLTAIDVSRDGVKTAFIKISDHQMLVVTSRRAEEWSSGLSKNANGLLVYEVDTRRDRNTDAVEADANGLDNGNNPKYSKWAFYLLPDGSNQDYSIRRSMYEYVVQIGQSVTFEGVKVTYKYSGKDDVVEFQNLNS